METNTSGKNPSTTLTSPITAYTAEEATPTNDLMSHS
jgi:hypothetical protein